jgi:HD domain
MKIPDSIRSRKAGKFASPAECPQAGRERMVMPQPIALVGPRVENPERELLKRMSEAGAVFMMGQNPDLPVMPEKPTLLDFFHYRFSDIAFMHLLQSAKLALQDGHKEKVVVACLLHDIANGALLRVDHGYWGAQMIAPYVSEEIAWAVKYHQALRYFADEAAGFKYPDAYNQFFGSDYKPPEYLCKANEEARNHRWYMTSRLVTIYDIYSFQDDWNVDPAEFTDIVGRHFRQPEEGLGFDDSPAAHMWRSMIWPHNFL